MNILIIGAGISGLAAAKLASAKGHSVFISDSNEKQGTPELKNELDELGIEYQFGSNSIKNIDRFELAVVSPGIPPSAEIIKQIEANNIKIISEVEFAYTQIEKDVKIIGVTGTNGKTTTVHLIHHILMHCGKKSHLVGNVGKAFSDIVNRLEDNDIVVLELSSYQLDRIEKFKPDVAVILNISPDHLEYHGSFEQYVRAKWKITLNQTKENLLVLNIDDKILNSIINNSESVFEGDNLKTDAEIGKISIQNNITDNRGIYLGKGTVIYINKQHKEEIMSKDQIPLFGDHNLYNSFASTIAAKYLQIRNEDVRDAMSSFKGIEHRLEVIKEVYGVRFINDSKATNVNSAWYALNSFNNDIIWIAGGMKSQNDYSVLKDLVSERVKYLICYGEEKNKLFDEFSGVVKCFIASNLTEAVQEAAAYSRDGDTILLSPACKSFDSFVNFEHRGQAFKQIVESLT